jgi:hypothetical protein
MPFALLATTRTKQDTLRGLSSPFTLDSAPMSLHQKLMFVVSRFYSPLRKGGSRSSSPSSPSSITIFTIFLQVYFLVPILRAWSPNRAMILPKTSTSRQRITRETFGMQNLWDHLKVRCPEPGFSSIREMKDVSDGFSMWTSSTLKDWECVGALYRVGLSLSRVSIYLPRSAIKTKTFTLLA